MRLIDFRCHWLRQYFPELVAYEHSKDAEVAGRLGELAGYLSAVSAAVLLCARDPSEWAAMADPWPDLHEMIARYQAEFSGRILMGPDDAERWRREPADGLCWGLIGVAGFEGLIRNEGDLDHLPTLFERGIRLFQPIGASGSVLGGSSDAGDHGGLTTLGKEFLERLTSLVPGQSSSTPRPILDLAGANSFTVNETLDWYESNPSARERVLLLASDAAVATVFFTSDPGTLLTLETVHRLRELGGVVALGLSRSRIGSPELLAETIRTLESIPFEGHKGLEGIAISSDYLGRGGAVGELQNAESIMRWFNRTFDRSIARAILHDQARLLFLKAAGAAEQPAGMLQG